VEGRLSFHDPVAVIAGVRIGSSLEIPIVIAVVPSSALEYSSLQAKPGKLEKC